MMPTRIYLIAMLLAISYCGFVQAQECQEPPKEQLLRAGRSGKDIVPVSYELTCIEMDYQCQIEIAQLEYCRTIQKADVDAQYENSNFAAVLWALLLPQQKGALSRRKKLADIDFQYASDVANLKRQYSRQKAELKIPL